MITALYVNHGHSEVCGVHDLGRRHARIIAAAADDIELDYIEANDFATYNRVMESRDFDVVIINYMPGIMPWVDKRIKTHRATRIAVIHNYQHDTIDQVAAEHHRLFDYMLALDPTLHATNPWVLTTNRPLPAAAPTVELPDKISIGTFGFAFPHKNFPAVAAEMAATVDDGVFDLHMPEAYFNGVQGGQLYTDTILVGIHNALRLKPGIRVHHTASHLEPEELVARLSGNHVNCLFYIPGQHNAGLSSALDYLVAARRPILVTDCAMFAHFRQGCAVYPDVRLRDVLADLDGWTSAADALYIEAISVVGEQTADLLRRFV